MIPSHCVSAATSFWAHVLRASESEVPASEALPAIAGPEEASEASSSGDESIAEEPDVFLDLSGPPSEEEASGPDSDGEEPTSSVWLYQRVSCPWFSSLPMFARMISLSSRRRRLSTTRPRDLKLVWRTAEAVVVGTWIWWPSM